VNKWKESELARITSTIAAFGLLVGVAQADVVLSFGFTDTSGAYDGAGSFSASAVDAGTLRTSGDVTSLTGAGGTAEFDAGFAGATADFTVDLSVGAIVGGSRAGSGAFTITDADGDTITGDIDGDWLSGGGDIVFFNGFLSNVFLNDTGLGGTFDGPSSGQFDMDIAGQPLEGAFVTLFIATGSGFFDSAFSGVSTQVDGVVVPAPAGVMALAGLGLMAARRRRA
jgi:hypothetical protein